jgi:hypothetical protein
MESFIKADRTKQSYVNAAGKLIKKNTASIFFSEKLEPVDQIKLALIYPLEF